MVTDFMGDRLNSGDFIVTFDVLFPNLREEKGSLCTKWRWWFIICFFFNKISASELFCKQRQCSMEHNLDISCQSVVAEARFRSHASPCQICGRQSASSIHFSPSNSVSPWQYQTNWMISVLARDVRIHWADWGFLCYEMARFITAIKILAVVRCCEPSQFMSYLHSACIYDTF
jgi:hypothetical protein